MSYQDNVENIHEFLCKTDSVDAKAATKKLNELFELSTPPIIFPKYEFKKLESIHMFSGIKEKAHKELFFSKEIRAHAHNGEVSPYWFTDDLSWAQKFSNDGLFHVVKTLPGFKAIDMPDLYEIYKSVIKTDIKAKPLDTFNKKEDIAKHFVCSQGFMLFSYLPLLYGYDAVDDSPKSQKVFKAYRRKNLAVCKDDITNV
jgi:hypothetical protein